MTDALETALARCDLTTDEGHGSRIASLEVVADELSRIGQRGGWVRLVPSADASVEFTVGATAGAGAWRLRTTADGDRRIEVNDVVPLLARWLSAHVPAPEAMQVATIRTVTLPLASSDDAPNAADADGPIGQPSRLSAATIAAVALFVAFFLPWVRVENNGTVSGLRLLRYAFDGAPLELALVALAPLAALGVVVDRQARHAASAIAPLLLVFATLRLGEWGLVAALGVGGTVALVASAVMALSDVGLPPLPARIALGAAAVAAVALPVLSNAAVDPFLDQMRRTSTNAYMRCINAADTTVEECEGLPGDPTPGSVEPLRFP